MLRTFASHMHELPLPASAEAAVPSWVQLIPAGTFTGRDGRGPYRLDDAEGVIRATNAWQKGARIPVDYDHQTVWTRENGRPALAAGWLLGLEARPDGLWAAVDWTPAAAAHIRAREYRYLSPVFAFEEATGRVLRLVSVALTNTPNLELKALNSSNEGADMNLLQQLRAALNLPAEADEAKAVAEVKALAGKAAVHATELAGLAKAAGLTETAGAAEIATAVTGLNDPARQVPLAAHQALAAELAALKATLAKDKAEAAVAEAMAAGKVAPALKDWALAYANRDLPGFIAYAAAAPAVVSPQTTAQAKAATATPPAAQATAAALSAEELAVSTALGVTPEAFAQNRQKEVTA